MANTVTSPKSVSTLRTYEDAGQLDLMKDKEYPIADLIEDIQSGLGMPLEVIDTNGAISSTVGTVLLTKAGVAAMTLAAPVAADNGKILRIVATTANAHTVTTPSNKINGNSSVATFGGSVGDYIELVAYSTVWYAVGSANITLS